MKRTLLFAALMAASTLSAAETLYVQSNKAKLLETPQFNAPAVGELQKGNEVNVLQQQKRWVEVEYQGNSGWLSRFLLSDHPPLKKVTVLGDGETLKLEENARRRASAVTTAGAARGLSADDRKRSNSGDKSDYFALEKVENYKVEDKAVTEFIEQGK